MVSRRDEVVRAAWGFALAALLMTALTWLPVLPSWGERLASFRLHAAIVSLLMTVVLAAMRLRRPALAWLALAALNGAWVPPRALPIGPAPAVGRPPITFPIAAVTYNVNSDSVSFDKVIHTLEEAEPDLIVIEELSPKWKEQLVRLSEYRYRSMYPDTSNWGFGLVSRFPILSSELLAWPGLATAYGIRAEVRVGGPEEGEGVNVTILGLHLITPVDDAGLAERDAQLAAAAAIARDVKGPLLVLGDLNTTPWTSQFRALLRDGGLRDGAAWRWVGATWPRHVGPFGIPIDHVLVGGSADVDGMAVLDGGGSDHSALIARLAVWSDRLNR